MAKKQMIAMLLAGGQGSRLGVLTQGMAKPAVAFGGKYRIIDFPLSNCVNSDVDTVGVLTQYRPLQLNSHIGIGIPWDLDKQVGGVTVLPPYERSGDSEWYTGTANAIYQNMEFMDQYNPDYVLILSGDHIYKMDYEEMLTRHKSTGAEATIAVMPVPWEEAHRFGIMVADGAGHITEFEEKPANPKSNLASMGIYIFNYSALKSALIELSDVPNCDFGMHVIPYLFRKTNNLYTYEFHGYWKDVGTLTTYWETNMALTDLVPEFNLYEEFWQIYTSAVAHPPAFFAKGSKARQSIIGDGSVIEGGVKHSVLGSDVVIKPGAKVYDSILMNGVVIEEGAIVRKAIIAENTVVGRNTRIGEGNFEPSRLDPKVYNSEITVIGSRSTIPEGIVIGKNVAIMGTTTAADYPNGVLESGEYIIKRETKA
ncbi:MAG: glucose-1-phosphate adenylyltransferase [Lachnospiraceae bacterium]|nr:glucose-1-phosphate adenylyltransferase [Lachnospiraceae bacterium]